MVLHVELLPRVTLMFHLPVHLLLLSHLLICGWLRRTNSSAGKCLRWIRMDHGQWLHVTPRVSRYSNQDYCSSSLLIISVAQNGLDQMVGWLIFRSWWGIGFNVPLMPWSNFALIILEQFKFKFHFVVLECIVIMDLGHDESNQYLAQFKWPLNWNQFKSSNAFGGLLKTKVQNQLTPKIVKPLLINPKYSVEPVSPGWRFY